jgi:hypothetical protein
MICALMLFLELMPDPDTAMRFYADKRTKNGKVSAGNPNGGDRPTEVSSLLGDGNSPINGENEGLKSSCACIRIVPLGQNTATTQ